MQIVILCGGYGTRLKNLSKKKPKAMITFGNKPFIYLLIKYYQKQGFKDFLLLCSYKKEIIINFFKKKKIKNIKINFSSEKKPCGTGGALIQAYNKLKNKFILINGDTFVDLNLSNLIKYKYLDKLFIGIKKYNFLDKDTSPNILVKHKTIIDYKKDNKNYNYTDIGISMWNKEFLYNPRQKKFNIEDIYLKQLIKKNKVNYFICKKKFYDIGSVTKIKKYNNFLKKKLC